MSRSVGTIVEEIDLAQYTLEGLEVMRDRFAAEVQQRRSAQRELASIDDHPVSQEISLDDKFHIGCASPGTKFDADDRGRRRQARAESLVDAAFPDLYPQDSDARRLHELAGDVDQARHALHTRLIACLEAPRPVDRQRIPYGGYTDMARALQLLADARGALLEAADDLVA